MHDIPSSGHPGTDKMLAKIQQSFYWPAMKSDVETYCSKCHQCAGRKPAKPYKSPIGSIPTLASFERCVVDMCKHLHMHPQSNGTVERLNRTLGVMLSMYCGSNQPT